MLIDLPTNLRRRCSAAEYKDLWRWSTPDVRAECGVLPRPNKNKGKLDMCDLGPIPEGTCESSISRKERKGPANSLESHIMDIFGEMIPRKTIPNPKPVQLENQYPTVRGRDPATCHIKRPARRQETLAYHNITTMAAVKPIVVGIAGGSGSGKT